MLFLSHIKYHGGFLWDEVTVDWLSMSTWFDTISALGARMRVRGLGHPLFVAQTMWFWIPNVCNAKGERVEHGIEDYEVRDGNDV